MVVQVFQSVADAHGGSERESARTPPPPVDKYPLTESGLPGGRISILNPSEPSDSTLIAISPKLHVYIITGHTGCRDIGSVPSKLSQLDGVILRFGTREWCRNTTSADY